MQQLQTQVLDPQLLCIRVEPGMIMVRYQSVGRSGIETQEETDTNMSTHRKPRCNMIRAALTLLLASNSNLAARTQMAGTVLWN
jgi:2-methylaconitate cis-trans-isomerase PrpF